MSKREKNNMKLSNVKKTFAVIGIAFAGLIGYTAADAYSTAVDLKNDASALKEQLRTAINSLENEDIETAQSAMEQVDSTNSEMKAEMNKPIMKIAALVSGQVRSVNTLLSIVNEASTNIINPAIDTLSNYPISQLKVGEDGFNVNLINGYLNLADNIMPHVIAVSDELNTVNISIEKEKIEEYKQKLNNISNQYNEIKDFFPVLHAILGDGSDKYYLFPIQNTAEMRACGGFPGSIGSITISNGVLTIGDFDTPYNIFPENEEGDWASTETEINYFSANVMKVRDAGFNPDFSRVAYIWAKGKEAASGQYVDGVISMTPAMVQNMLEIIGQSITLSDGTVLDGNNATKYLQYDIYDKYFEEYGGTIANEITDALFAETAEKAMSSFVSAFSFDNVMSYMPLISNGIDNREIMFWFANNDEEQAAREAGCSGALNNGINNALTQIYFSISGTKAGWFFDIDNQVIDQVKNEDGTTTYHMQTNITNNLTQDEIAKQNPYILNTEKDGIFHSFVQIVAPYGGAISDVTSGAAEFNIGEYNGNQLAYSLDVPIYPQTTVTITFTVTVASDVSNAATFVTTPTLTKYRQVS